MVGSIDPRCETVRGIHWPKKGREVVWSSRRGNHLGQRPKATASTGRTYGCKRSDQTLKKLLWHGGRPHMGPRVRGDDIELETVTARSQRVPPSAGPMINSATKQSIFRACGLLDCLAEPVIGARIRATRWPAMTVSRLPQEQRRRRQRF